MSATVRKAFVAGKFYPDSRLELENLIQDIRAREKDKFKFDPSVKQIIGGVLPHAGIIYSGYQTVHFFETLSQSKQSFDSFVILHPIHRGGEMDFACDENDLWSTPLGKMEIDREFVEAMDLPCSGKTLEWEHSGEVILPYLQYYNFQDKKIIPIGIGWQHPETSRIIAEKLHQAQKELNRKICIIASSDFSHFVDPETGWKQDQKALDKIMEMKAENLYSAIRKDNISICGYGPIMTLIYYSEMLDTKVTPKVLARGHSGEVSQGNSVVDYISILFYS